MSSLTITLPNGSQQSVPDGARPIDVAQSISPRLANDAIVARVDGELYDLTRPFEHDSKLEILTTKNPEALQVYRHSTAHLLAAAVLELYPETQLGIGPPTESGFYYDFDRATKFIPEDLEKIEAHMREIATRNLPFDRKLTAKKEGLAKYKGDWMKHELIEERAGDIFTEYTLGPQFIDFCRGPHVPSTEKLKAFKLLSIAGAYWKGSEKNPQLQRIYGTAFFTKKELDDYLNRLEEAKKRDHRRVGKELELFTVSELVGAGLPLWLPKGATVRRVLEEYILERERATGYQHVYTPDLAESRALSEVRPLGALSRGHVPSHGSRNGANGAASDELSASYFDLQGEDAQLSRPAGAHRRARHDVPLRTVGRAQRAEPGPLDDAERRAYFLHAGPDQSRIYGRDAACRSRLSRSRHHAIQLSSVAGRPPTPKNTSPTRRCGTLAERVLREAMDSLGLPYKEAPGEAAFYGPKLDIQLADVMGHEETYSTIQIDFHLPNDSI